MALKIKEVFVFELNVGDRIRWFHRGVDVWRIESIGHTASDEVVLQLVSDDSSSKRAELIRDAGDDLERVESGGRELRGITAQRPEFGLTRAPKKGL
jgi:hypothetical protein